MAGVTTVAHAVRPDAVEVLPPGEAQVEVIARPHPLRSERVRLWLPAGLSLSEVVERVQPRAELRRHVSVAIERDRQVWIVPRDRWGGARPKAGCRVVVRAYVGAPIAALAIGVVASVAGAAVTAATSAILGATLAGVLGALASGAISFLGKMLIPQQKPKLNLSAAGANRSSGGQSPAALAAGRRSPSLTGARNQLRPWDGVPLVLGRIRHRPPLAAPTYTEVVGNDQYLRILLLWGMGAYDISDIRIGDTPIGRYDGVEVETHVGSADVPYFRLYPRAVTEESMRVALTREGAWHHRTTDPRTVEIQGDFLFPAGLREIDEQTGSTRAYSVRVGVQYRRATGGGWSNAPGYPKTIRANTADTLRRGFRIGGLAEGAYDVRVRLEDGRSTSQYVSWEPYWTSVRSIAADRPITIPWVTATALRIKASDQLDGIVDTVSAIQQTVCRDWNGSAWVTRATSSPAALFAHAATGPHLRHPMDDGEIDWAALEIWADRCIARGWSFAAVYDFQTALSEALGDVALAGRAYWHDADGQLTVGLDEPRDSYAQVFTERNSAKFSGKHNYIEPVHGLRVSFRNRYVGWDQDERIVYADGYSAANATEIRDIEMFGVDDPAEIQRIGRRRLAEMKLRLGEYVLTTSYRHLMCQRGDLVAVNHSTPMFGLASGRVLEVLGGADPETGDPVATGVRLDTAVPMAADASYAVLITLADSTTLSRSLVGGSGLVSTLTFAVAVPEALGPTEGDLVSFGPAGHTHADLLVRSIDPGPDLSARVTLMDYGPGVFTAEDEPIPPWQSQITAPVQWGVPPAPVIESIRSDETALIRRRTGHLLVALRVAYRIARGWGELTTEVEGQIRRQDGGDWMGTLRQPDRVGVLVWSEVEERAAYDVRLRARSRTGDVSPWVTVTGHTIVGFSTLPPDVPGLYLEGDWLSWPYPNAPADLAGFRIRAATGVTRALGAAALLHSGLVSAPPFRIGGLSGTVSIMVTAVDIVGNESAEPAVLTYGFGDPVLANVVEETALHPTWPGTISGGAIEDGHLAATITDAWWPGDTADAWWPGDTDGVWWGSNTAPLMYEALWTPERAGDLVVAVTVDAPDGTLDTANRWPSASWPGDSGDEWWPGDVGDTWGPEPAPVAAAPPGEYTLEIAEVWPAVVWPGDTADAWWPGDTEDIWWPESAPTWRPLPARMPITRSAYTIRLSCPPGSARTRIEALTLIVDVPDSEEVLADVVIAPGGTRLPTATPWAAIKAVHLTLQDDDGAAVTARVKDKLTIGPLVEALNTAGAGTGASVDARIQGYV
jgi:hypothetical protein